MALENIAELRKQVEQSRILQYPLKLAEAAAALARARGIDISSDDMVYTLDPDVLDKPEMFIGLPIKGGEVICSERFVVYDGDEIRAYAGDGNIQDFTAALSDFVSKVKNTRR